MRFVCLLFLLAFVGAVILFAYQNQQEVGLTFFEWQINSTMAIVIGAAYILGMFSGWTIVGMLRRSFSRAAQLVDDRQPVTVLR